MLEIQKLDENFSFYKNSKNLRDFYFI